jgi:hypothetical protein
MGMGRTFQNLAMFRTMPVLENVMVGAHCRSSAGFLASALRLPRLLCRPRLLLLPRCRPCLCLCLWLSEHACKGFTAAQEEEEGLDSTQHNEKYTQGTLLVSSHGFIHEMEVEEETEEDIENVRQIVTERTKRKSS